MLNTQMRVAKEAAHTKKYRSHDKHSDTVIGRGSSYEDGHSHKMHNYRDEHHNPRPQGADDRDIDSDSYKEANQASRKQDLTVQTGDGSINITTRNVRQVSKPSFVGARTIVKGFVKPPKSSPKLPRNRISRPHRSSQVMEAKKAREAEEAKKKATRLGCCGTNFVIIPDTRVKQAYDVMMLVMIVYNVMEIPLFLAFNLVYEGALYILSLTMDITFCLDLLVNFNTAILVNSHLVTDRRVIAEQYLKTWFFCDLVSGVPIEWFMPLFDRESDNAALLRLPRLFKFLRLFRLMKLLRLLKAARIFKKLNEIWDINLSVMSLMELMFGLVFVAHLVACAWFAIPSLIEGGPESGWIEAQGLVGAHWSNQYLYSFYWSLTTLTTVGYGDILPSTPGEVTFTMFVMMLGVAFFGYLIGNISSLMSNMDIATSTYKDKMENVRQYMRFRQFPREMQLSVVRYFEHYWQRKSVFDEAEILNCMSSSLRCRVLLYLYKDLLAQVPLFRDQGDDFVIKRPC